MVKIYIQTFIFFFLLKHALDNLLFCRRGAKVTAQNSQVASISGGPIFHQERRGLVMMMMMMMSIVKQPRVLKCAHVGGAVIHLLQENSLEKQ